MPELKISSVLDNSAIDRGLEKTKAAFDELYSYIKKKDFGEEFGKQLQNINKDVEETVKNIESSVADLQKKIDDLTIKRNQAISEGNGSSAGSFQVMIDGLVKERTELLKNLTQYQNYKDEISKAAQTAETFLDKQERQSAAFAKLGNVIKLGAVVGVKSLITAVKAFLNIGLVAVVNAIATAFASLLKYIKSTEAGQMALTRVTGYLSGLFTSLKTTAMQVGKALFDSFSTVKPAVDAVINRVAALVATINSLIKIGGSALSRDWEGVSKEFENMKGNLKAIWTGGLFDSTQAGQIKAQAEYTRDLYLEREKLKNQAEEWSEEKANLELQIAEAESKKDYAKAKSLNEQIYNRELEYLEKEYDIEKKLVDLKGEEAKTQADESKLRDLRTQITELKTSKVKSDTRQDNKEESAAAKRERELAKEQADEEKRIRKEEQLQNELNAMLLSNQERRIELMDEGSKKEIEQIQHSYEQRAEEIRKQKEKWAKENKKLGRTGLNADGLTEEQSGAITAASSINERSREKAINDIAQKNREQYLKEYGDYEQKRLAITEEYDRKMLAETDEFARKLLEKQREKELDSLRKQYKADYALIFADADALSDNLLTEAIKATQDEIKKAQSEGDIEKLRILYESLKKQLTEKSGREDWGFIGLASAFKELEEAQKDYENAVDTTSQNEAALRMERILTSIRKRASDVGSVFTELGGVLEGIDGTVGEIGSGISALGGAAKNIVELVGQLKQGITPNKGASIVSVLSGAIQLAGMLANSIKANKDAQNAWNRTLSQSEHEMRMLNLEALDYKQQNIFGVENPYKKAIDGAKQYSEAMKVLQEQTARLNSGKVQTGTKKAINWANVGKGAAIGASAGAVAGAGIFSGITAAAGAAIGAAAGIVTGLLSTKVVPIFENLTTKYGKVVTENFELNPQLIADYDKLDDETKKLVDNWKDIKAKAEEAEAQMKETFTNLAGDLGGQLSDSLVNAFKNGKLNSAIDDFHSKMNSTIEDIVEQMVFSNVFSEMFDNLEKEMAASFDAAGDMNIVDDLMRFEEAYKAGLEEYGKQMEEAKEYLQTSGYQDAFKSDASRTASSRASLGASQDSIDESNGRLTAIQAQVFQMNETVTSFKLNYERLIANTAATLEHTQGIHVDTTELKGMVSEMRELSRSVNRNINEMVDKGVKMK